MKWELAVVDFDGTLADTEPLHHETYNVLLRLYDSSYELNDFTPFIGMTEIEIWPAVLERFPKVTASPARLRDARAQLFLGLCLQRDLRPDDAVVDAVPSLGPARTVILSSQQSSTIDHLLSLWRLRDRFGVIWGADRWTCATKADMFVSLVGDLPPQHVAVFEDSIRFAEVAKAHGAHVTGIVRDYNANIVGSVDAVVEANPP